MNEIGIRIFWGPWDGKFNPSPIVSVGNIVGNIVPTAPALVNEELSWMIKLDEWKAVYSCFSKENCVNSDSYMQLLVCVVIPKGQRLDGGKSPLDLLEAVRNQFDLLFSFDLEATLPSKEKVDLDFSKLLESYILTECPWYVFDMEGSDPASFCVESRSQLDALMRFNAYKELAHVEHLELGFKCKTTVNINTKGEASDTTQKAKRRWWEKDKAEAQSKPLEKEQPSKEPINEPKNEPEKEPILTSKSGTSKEVPNRIMKTTDNDSNFRIAIYIGGNVVRGNGFGQIVSVGALAGMEYEKLDAAPISRASTTENPVITIKNTETYVLYKIWDDSILISDDKNGSLCIGMTVPAQARLKDGKSPYMLLMDIYHKFLELGTEPTEDGRRRFKKLELDKAVFQSIIDQYPIEYAPNRMAPMTGNRKGQLQITSIKDMEDFFRDTQYEEFTDYEAIEVTKEGLNQFPGLVIPRPISYEVFVNGSSTGIFLQRNDHQFCARIDDNEDVRYNRITFSIDRLLQSPTYTLRSQDDTAFVKLDENYHRIDCLLKPIPILYRKRYRFTTDSDDEGVAMVKGGLTKGTVKIMIDGNEWNEEVISPSKAKAAIKGNTLLDIYPHEIDGYCVSLNGVSLDEAREELVVSIKTKKTRNKKKKFYFVAAILGLLIGCIVGLLWIKPLVMEKNRLFAIKQEEELAFHDALNRPHRNPSIEVEHLDTLYLEWLQKEGGPKEYYDYLCKYGKDVNPDAYNAAHFLEVNTRLKKYKSDSLEYVQFIRLKEEEKAKEMAQKAQRDDEKENITKEDVIRRRVEEEALAFLNNDDLKGFREWCKHKNEGKTNKQWLGHNKSNSIDIILGYPQGPKGYEVRAYLKEKYPSRNFKNTNRDWKRIEEEARTIESMSKN